MCLSVPAQIISIDGEIAEVSIGGTIFKAGIQMIENPAIGEYVLLHAGFAIQRISEGEANITLNIISEMQNKTNPKKEI